MNKQDEDTKAKESLKETKKGILPKEYSKPEVQSENLMAFAASCNGTTTGGRKASVGAPAPFCNARKLNS